MTPYQKESQKATLLIKLDDFKTKLTSFKIEQWESDTLPDFTHYQIIDRNLTSIEKQIKRL